MDIDVCEQWDYKSEYGREKNSMKTLNCADTNIEKMKRRVSINFVFEFWVNLSYICGGLV